MTPPRMTDMELEQKAGWSAAITEARRARSEEQRLTEENARLRDKLLDPSHPALQLAMEESATLRARCERLTQAMNEAEDYLEHRPRCFVLDQDSHGKCDCGFDGVQVEFRAALTERSVEK